MSAISTNPTDFSIPKLSPTQRQVRKKWKERYDVEPPPIEKIPCTLDTNWLIKKLLETNRIAAIFQEFIDHYPDAASEQYRLFYRRKTLNPQDQRESTEEELSHAKIGLPAAQWHRHHTEEIRQDYFSIFLSMHNYNDRKLLKETNEHITKTVVFTSRKRKTPE